MLKKAFSYDIVAQLRVYACYQRFKAGRKCIEGDARSECPSMAITKKKILQIVFNNRRVTMKEMVRK